MEENTKNTDSGEESAEETMEASGDGEEKNADTENDSEKPSTEALEEKVAELEAKYLRTHERLLRTAAELDNFRKRTKRDLEDAAARGRTEVLQETLPVLDSIGLALSSANPEGDAAGIIEGVKMIKKQFLAATERFNLHPVESVGLAFDPNVHEAVAQVASDDQPAGCVVEEMRTGYLLGDKLLRAAMVVVSRGPEKPAPSDSAESQNEETGEKQEESAVEEKTSTSSSEN